MPAIPLYNQRYAPTLSGGGVKVTPGDAPAAALGELGKNFTAIGLELQKQQEAEEMVKAENMLLDGKQQWANDLENRQKQWNFEGTVAGDMNEQYDTWVKKERQQFKTKSASAYFEAKARSAQKELNFTAQNFEKTAYQQRSLNDLANLGERLTSDLYENPDLMREHLVSYAAAIEANTYLTGQEKAALYEAAQKNMAIASISAGMKKDPDKYNALIQGENSAQAQGTAAASKGKEIKFNILPEQTAMMEQYANGNQELLQAMKIVLMIENQGFGYANNQAVSNAGAIGAFQFMPKTAAAYRSSKTGEYFKPEDMHDFENSTDAAAQFLQELYNQYDGNLMAVLAHYNGGTAAGKAVMEGREPPSRETRNYLRMAKEILGMTDEAALSQEQGTVDIDPDLKEMWDLLSFEDKQKLSAAHASLLNAKQIKDKQQVYSTVNEQRERMISGSSPDHQALLVLCPENLKKVCGKEEAKAISNEMFDYIQTTAFTPAMRAFDNFQLENMAKNGATKAMRDIAGRILTDRQDPVNVLMQEDGGDEGYRLSLAKEQDLMAQYNNTANPKDKEKILKEFTAVRQQRYAIAEQKQQDWNGGLPSHLIKPRFWSNNELKIMQAVMNNGSPEEVRQEINMMKLTDGEYFHPKYSEIFVDGSVNYELLALADAKPEDIALLLSMARRSVDELRKDYSVSESDAKKRDLLIGNKMKNEFAKTIAPDNEYLPEVLRWRTNMIKKLTDYFVLTQPDIGYEKAVDKAYEMIMGPYVVSDTLLIPKGIMNNPKYKGIFNLDSRTIANIASGVNEFSHKWLDEHSDEIYVIDDNKKMYKDALFGKEGLLRKNLRQLKYYKTDDDSGFMVYAVGTNNKLYPIYKNDGTPLIFEWGQVFDLSAGTVEWWVAANKKAAEDTEKMHEEQPETRPGWSIYDDYPEKEWD